MSPFHQPWSRSKNGTLSTLRTDWFVQADTLWTSDLIGRGIWIDKNNSMKTGRQEVESNRRFYKHAFTNRIRASIQWDKSEKHTPGVQNTQPTPTCEWSQHVRQCEILRIICYVCMWVPVYLSKTHLCLQKRFRQSNTTVYSEVLSHVCVRERNKDM